MPYRNQKVENNLLRDESLETHCYKDSLGFETIGIGRCIAKGKKGISVDEAYYLLRNDIDEAYRGLALYGWFTQLDVPRQNVLIEMAFNLGVRGLLGFKKMIEAIQSKDYKLASTEMLDSTWAKQVKSRAARMAKRMELGID